MTVTGRANDHNNSIEHYHMLWLILVATSTVSTPPINTSITTINITITTINITITTITTINTTITTINITITIITITIMSSNNSLEIITFTYIAFKKQNKTKY
ncbi:hypothetical protein PoB_000383800 [Plakobranchus ocellatus]|uniref:Uncharacterized protein n=1 Tax=Plakobranchus ocellatus TaxID=259542 RepID=A0AAV3Y567_9GAST|nr:hypothetical protein PoB_000383800 [Plakobranchus ocellatus]